MLPNYLRTYSSALCQIRALEKAFKKQNNGQSVPKMLVLNACIWLARTNTQNLHAILYVFLPVTMTCAELCWQTYLGTYSPAFCHIWALKKTFEKSYKCQTEPKIWVLDAYIWLARTNRQNWVQYFPCENDLCRAMLPDCLGMLSSNLCQISALKEAIG